MKNIIFDWSGVVRDTVPSQLWIVNRIFERYGVVAITLEEFRENWEQPYTSFYKKYLPSDYIEGERAQAYREFLFDKDCPVSSAYQGMVELIRKLKDRGYFLAVVSSDLPESLLPEVKEWGLEGIFNEIATVMDDKTDVVRELIKNNKLNPAETCFVGDSNHEIDVAKETGIRSIAVTWGFTTEHKLRARNPDYVAHTVAELESLIL